MNASSHCVVLKTLSAPAVLLMSTLLPASVHAAISTDLTAGAVFAMSNAREGNVVVAFSRGADGRLHEVGRFPTQGAGSGSFEDTANGLVLATRAGEIAPNNVVEPGDSVRQWLLVTNAGSNSISVFAVHADKLKLVEVQHSRGEKPVSITINSGIVYVLNSGETNDNLFDAAGNVIPNCTTGSLPSVTGFRLDGAGQLHRIRGSTRLLSGEHVSGCAQVSFDPSGRLLVVTERLAQLPRQQMSDEERLDDEGLIVTYEITDEGRLHRRRLVNATGQGPFGFTFTRAGGLLATEQFDGPDGPGLGAAASYLIDLPEQTEERSSVPKGLRLLRSSPSIQNGGTDTCWFVVTDDQALGFATSFFGDGRISSYQVDDLGLVRLMRAVATGSDSESDDVMLGASDLALSRDSAYLYQLNSINGTISAFSNNGDGTLTLIEQHTPFPQRPFGPGGGEGAPIGLAAN